MSDIDQIMFDEINSSIDNRDEPNTETFRIIDGFEPDPMGDIEDFNPINF